MKTLRHERNGGHFEDGIVTYIFWRKKSYCVENFITYPWTPYWQYVTIGSNNGLTPNATTWIARFMGPTWGPSGVDSGILFMWVLLKIDDKSILVHVIYYSLAPIRRHVCTRNNDASVWLHIYASTSLNIPIYASTGLNILNYFHIYCFILISGSALSPRKLLFAYFH